MSWDIETKLPVPCYGSTGIQYKKRFIYLVVYLGKEYIKGLGIMI